MPTTTKHPPTQMTLGELIASLKKIEQADNGDRGVRYDFVYHYPTTLNSYRGIYPELALGYADDDKTYPKTVTELRELCESAIGQTFEGWHGGTFTMNEDTPLWVANEGETGRTAIVSVQEIDGEIVLDTAAIR